MTCSACGGENESGRRFCGDCGAPLAVVCPACGAANPARVRFCGECGTALAAVVPVRAVAAAPVPPPAEPVTERRLVSVLFADLVGFTTLSEARDSEEVRELLSGYFDTCRTIVARYGGVVEKFIGDAVMAVWGAPVANEDDAERAVRAALELVDAVTQLGDEVGAPGLRARAGVLTGEATVNLGATGQGMVAGDLVNTASRLQSVAEPGTVVAGDPTKRATDAAVAYTDAGFHALKGKAEPVRVWRAHRVVAGVGGLMRSEGLEPPFVGRDRELKLVKDLFHACHDEGRAHLVQVTGIAGIGKSRLGWEFFKYMDGLSQVFRWHRGRCLSYGEGVAYWALAEMVRGRAGIVEGEERTSAVAKLHDAIERYVPDPTDRRFIEPRLAHLIGLEERTASDQGDLFAGWRLFFERLAASDPVVMVFEDLQWADPSLLEFIDHLLEWSRAFPIFVMTLARPGGGVLAGVRRNGTSIYLEPLSEPAMQQLLTGLVPGLPAELTRQILDRAEGVPLYAVETVRMLLDRGMLVQEGSVYRVAGQVEDLEVPETLHALIAARLDGLTPVERRVVQDASVLGKTCTRSALAAVSGLPERELEPVLAGLLAKEVLSVQADPRSPERGQYGFLQDLVRTVAYETLSKRDRKARHLAAAAYMERTWGGDDEEIVEVVASHFVEAYRLAPDADDAAAIRDRARGMLVRAGERAASLAAASEAQAYFDRAADLADSAEEQGRLVERSGQMAMLRGHLEEGVARFERAKQRFEDAGQTHSAARVMARLAETEMLQNRNEGAVTLARQAYEMLGEDEADADLAVVAAQLGRFLVLSGRTEEGMPVLEEALRLSEQLGLRDVYAQALSSRAIAIMRQARFDEATTLLRRALDVAHEHDLGAVIFRAWNNLAVALEWQDRYREEWEIIPPALELARRKGDRANELSIVVGKLVPLVALGRWDEAVAVAEEMRDVEELAEFPWIRVGLFDAARARARRGEFEEVRRLDALIGRTGEGNEEVESMLDVLRAEALRLEGRPAEALVLAERCVSRLSAFSLASTSVKGGLVEAVEACLDLGDLDRADQHLQIVRTARPGMVMPVLRAHAARLEARLAAARGSQEQVEPGLRVAAGVFDDLEMPFEAALATLELAEWLVVQHRAAEAEAALAQARATFERLGARPWLERCGRLVVDAPQAQPAHSG